MFLISNCRTYADSNYYSLQGLCASNSFVEILEPITPRAFDPKPTSHMQLLRP